MVNRVVATKLTEEEHSKLIDFCNSKGCTPFSLIKEAILEKISQKEGTKESIKETETNDQKNPVEELKKYLGVKKVSRQEPTPKEFKVEARRKPTLEESLDHMKNCRNPECKYGRLNIMKNS